MAGQQVLIMSFLDLNKKALNLINKLCLHQFFGTKTTKTNKLLKTDANVAY